MGKSLWTCGVVAWAVVLAVEGAALKPKCMDVLPHYAKRLVALERFADNASYPYANHTYAWAADRACCAVYRQASVRAWEKGDMPPRNGCAATELPMVISALEHVATRVKWEPERALALARRMKGYLVASGSQPESSSDDAPDAQLRKLIAVWRASGSASDYAAAKNLANRIVCGQRRDGIFSEDLDRVGKIDNLHLGLQVRLAQAVDEFGTIAKTVEGWRDPVRMTLWPEGRMPSVQSNQTYAPYVDWYAPKIPKSKAVVINCSGGGYNGSGDDGFEVEPIRRYLLDRGVTVATLRYRAPRPQGLAKHVTAWQDAQRAIRLVRREAVRRGLDPERIGFTGCSAGGHLTLLAATSSTVPAYARVDELDDLPCHVNFAIPVYPAYVLMPETDKTDVAGCDDLSAAFCPEFAFDAKTPPMCFFHGDTDDWSPMGSVRAYHRLRQMKIPAELHVISGVGHCFMEHPRPGSPAANWKDRAWEWMWNYGFID